MEAAGADSAAPVLTGSAALLAKMRGQREVSARKLQPEKPPPPAKKALIVYASQTGTAQEIARSLQAECAEHGVVAEVMSLNEVGFANVSAAKTPVIVAVASSTGDGDPPDNAAHFWVAIKRSLPADHLQGVHYTVLGLGDSNYTRFMHVPRTLRSRFGELGAYCFYHCAEADEVDGIETVVDAWTAGLWAPLQQTLAAAAVAGSSTAQETPSGRVTPADSESSSVLLAGITAGAPARGPPGLRMQLAAEGSQPTLIQDINELDIFTAKTAGAAKQSEAVAPAAAAVAADGTGLVDGLAPERVDLSGVPALPQCRIKLLWESNQDTVAAIRAREAESPSVDEIFYRDPEGTYSPEKPLWATITDASYLTSKSSDRQVLHVEFDIRDSGMKYAPGDAIGVVPRNSRNLVRSLLKRLNVDGDKIFSVAPAGESSGQSLLQHLRWPCSAKHALMYGCDVTSVPRKSLLRVLAEHTSDPAEKRTLLYMCCKAGRAAYAQDITAGQPSLLDLLNRFPSCHPPFEVVLDVLPPLAPRMYSITTSPLEFPHKLQVALTVVEFKTMYGTRSGVASTWLDKACHDIIKRQAAEGDEVRVPIFLRSGGDFKVHSSMSRPMIMIGPGTGVAPFRGFLQHRRHKLKDYKKKPGTTVLYFGCRREDEDFLYKRNLQSFLADGTLSSLRVAYSRAQKEKVYVQHLMREDGAKLWELIGKQEGYVYVCGDGAGMAKDVHACLVEIAQTHGGLSAADATALWARMAKQGTYVRDIWS